MNFEFSAEQTQLRNEARRFLEAKCPPKAVRAVLEGSAPFDRALWQGLAEMGFLGIAIPEEYGGLGAGYLELCVVAEELGRVIAPVPFSSSVFLATEFVLAAGSVVHGELVFEREVELYVHSSAKYGPVRYMESDKDKAGTLKPIVFTGKRPD